MGDLDARVAVVTGAASGIGAALVTALTARGARVLAVDLVADGLDEVAARTGAVAHVADVSSRDDTDAAMARALADLGGLDLVFLNAGILGRPFAEANAPYRAADLDLDRYRQVMAVNTDGVVYGTVAAATRMAERGGGAIVVTASSAGLTPLPTNPVYATSKHAVIGWVRSVAPALADEGVRIDAICPGGVATPLVGFDASAAGGTSRLLAPAQVAEAAIDAALDDEFGRAISVLAYRDPVVLEHVFAPVTGSRR